MSWRMCAVDIRDRGCYLQLGQRKRVEVGMRYCSKTTLFSTSLVGTCRAGEIFIEN
jgi:hypothetical protein